MKPKTKIGCGDWHKGWGYGGHDKVGKLEIVQEKDCPINFIWRGHSQGRHGQIWNKGSNARFMVTDGGLKLTECEGSYPVDSELIRAANTLLREHNLPELKENCSII